MKEPDVVQASPCLQRLLAECGYEVGRRLGVGAMATVYAARSHEKRDLPVDQAIKVLHAHLSLNPERVKAFGLEGDRGQRIVHPNVVRTLGRRDVDDVHFLRMESLPGQSLEVWMNAGWRAGSVSLESSIRIVCDALRGLHAIHELGAIAGSDLGSSPDLDPATRSDLVHLDVCPGNLMVLESGMTKVIDLGIAQWQGEVLREGSPRGRCAYTAPEILDGTEPFDRRADLWSVGTIFWELCTGARLFGGGTEVQSLRRVVEMPIPEPSTIRPEIPERFDRVIMHALQRDREARPATAKDWVDEVESALGDPGSISLGN